MYYDVYESPIGDLLIEANDDMLLQICFITCHDIQIKPNWLTQSCKIQLKEYFNNERQVFDLPLLLEGTDFQKSVWLFLRTIPFGEQRSYSDIACSIKKPKAVRAVGGANNKNRFSIIIPCHRVVGKNGKLVGYNGGVDKKEWLLKHEATLVNR